MASRIDFVEFVCLQLQALGSIYPRKMFGDYMVYVNGKAVILICDNIAYVKMHPGIADLMAEAETGCPYKGAKPHYILDVEHKATLLKTVRTLETLLPYPKEKSKPERAAAKILHPFKHLPNVGEQTEKDLLSMGYTSVEALRGKKAEALYEEECKMRGCIVDRCQLYLYRALEYYLNTDNPTRKNANGGIGRTIFTNLRLAVRGALNAPPFRVNAKDAEASRERCFGYDIRARTCARFGLAAKASSARIAAVAPGCHAAVSGTTLRCQTKQTRRI